MMSQPLSKNAQPQGQRPGDVVPTFRLLIVDDEDAIREGLVGYLENYHEAPEKYPYKLVIDSCENPTVARQLLAENQYDLVISDINMPEEDGFSLLKFIRATYPNTRTALITAYKVDEYIRNAKKLGVYNIIAKTAPFNFAELSTVVTSLLYPDSALDLKTYMADGAVLNEIVIKNSDQIMEAFQALMTFLTENNVANTPDLLTAVIEALTNAVYHVAKLPDGTLKYEKAQQIAALEENEYVYFYFGKDEEKIGIAIVDQGGRITADEIIYWLERNISGGNLMDTHGRGMYLIHTLVDRLLVNINPGQRTEIIMLSYFSDTYRSNKPIYINQFG